MLPANLSKIKDLIHNPRLKELLALKEKTDAEQRKIDEEIAQIVGEEETPTKRVRRTKAEIAAANGTQS